MNALEYIKNNFTDDVSFEARSAEWHFPAFMEKLYTFGKCTINGVSFTMMQDNGYDNLTAKVIITHGERVCEMTRQPVVFVTSSLPADGRKRMCEHRFAFIVPGVELYLPQLFAQLKEHQPLKTRVYQELGIAAQYLLVCYLNGFATSDLSIADAMKLTGYSRMAVIQAFNELEYFKAGSRLGRYRHFVFHHNKGELWEELRPKMTNPCKRIIGLDKLPEGLPVVRAGISALCRRSMLAPSEQQEYAIRRRDFYAAEKINTVSIAYAPILLQLWTYVPRTLADECVEPYSLYLSLQANMDDRIQICLDEMMRRVDHD